MARNTLSNGTQPWSSTLLWRVLGAWVQEDSDNPGSQGEKRAKGMGTEDCGLPATMQQDFLGSCQRALFIWGSPAPYTVMRSIWGWGPQGDSKVQPIACILATLTLHTLPSPWSPLSCRRPGCFLPLHIGLQLQCCLHPSPHDPPRHPHQNQHQRKSRMQCGASMAQIPGAGPPEPPS